jgi:hypothetical protein
MKNPSPHWESNPSPACAELSWLIHNLTPSMIKFFLFIYIFMDLVYSLLSIYPVQRLPSELIISCLCPCCINSVHTSQLTFHFDVKKNSQSLKVCYQYISINHMGSFTIASKPAVISYDSHRTIFKGYLWDFPIFIHHIWDSPSDMYRNTSCAQWHHVFCFLHFTWQTD